MTATELIESRRPWLRDRVLRAGLTRAGQDADEGVLGRIVAAYRLASAAERDRGTVRSGPWQSIRDGHMGELVALLEAGRTGPLAAYLRELPLRDAGHGFFQGRATHALATSSPEAERQRLVWIADAVVGLAEAIGLLDVVCPEARAELVREPPSLEEIVARIEAATGLPLGVPEICAGLFGLAIDDRVVHVRSVCAVAAALRIRDWLRERTDRPAADWQICEIGPGIGLVPTILGGLGIRRLVLVDLPELNAMQAYFLSLALPSHRLVLFGEPCPAAEPVVRIMPDFEFLGGLPLETDLVLNQDSLPELDLATVRRYLDRLPAVTRYFLSINQETRVPAGAPASGGFLPQMLGGSTTIRPLSRMPAWCRAGYVEELFACGPAAGGAAPST